METENQTYSKQQSHKNTPFELMFSTEQMKILSHFLPKGYSLESSAKNTRKSSKNLKTK